MDERQRGFLDELLTTASPSGFETPATRVWVDYVSAFADDVSVDAYGNAVATVEGSGDADVAFGGHADEIGFIVRAIDDDGFLSLSRIGGSDRTVMRGQHVTVHTDDPVHGVVGQTAIHLRDGDDDPADIEKQSVDVGATSREEAEELVEVGDPVTFSSGVQDLQGDRIAARGMDNRVGIWAAAEGLRRAGERGAEATVHAVATVQEEVGLEGARMVGFDLDPDAFVAVDVTHATDAPGAPGDAVSPVGLGDGPVVARGSTNHSGLVTGVREAADDEDIDVQLQAAGSSTGTDADAVFTARGATPSLNVGLPNRYMHTPVEVVDTADLDATADLLAAVGRRIETFDLGPGF
ncbi:M20/M25/M40 family metallo-hydrolase [Halomarina oriensis]|uniref:M20/M25/M40 family metallo-hydrolase n=1 Tax=Halomarina oriensis TaxID=671145 RepID=A0A6B0GWR3_9EURY|nr:M20/M25/M40 family metallo-hydrolase [Halomarina oriensis]MWG36188.1 M20/M25/M40 family metallo-hydrolase [Halomarina oriensis]